MNVYTHEPEQPAKACVIWMHGLGADAQDMMGLATQLPTNEPIRHVFMNAPIRPVTINNGMAMRAWYDILGLTAAVREDKAGIMESEQRIHDVIESQKRDGFKSHQLFLAGFSQGGAMALFTGLQMPADLGGIIALSGYLPLGQACCMRQNKSVPLFMAGGTFDPVIVPAMMKQSIDWMHVQGYTQIVSYEYPMEHAVCAQEIDDLAVWLTHRVTNLVSPQSEPL